MSAQEERRLLIEMEADLARRLRHRFACTPIAVEQADATALPFPDAAFSGAVSFTMLHHVPSPQREDGLLREARPVLHPGAAFAASDGRRTLVFRRAHLTDTMVLVTPDALAKRLEVAGFDGVGVEAGKGAFRFRAAAPARTSAVA